MDLIIFQNQPRFKPEQVQRDEGEDLSTNRVDEKLGATAVGTGICHAESSRLVTELCRMLVGNRSFLVPLYVESNIDIHGEY